MKTTLLTWCVVWLSLGVAGFLLGRYEGERFDQLQHRVEALEIQANGQAVLNSTLARQVEDLRHPATSPAPAPAKAEAP